MALQDKLGVSYCNFCSLQGPLDGLRDIHAGSSAAGLELLFEHGGLAWQGPGDVRGSIWIMVGSSVRSLLGDF